MTLISCSGTRRPDRPAGAVPPVATRGQKLGKQLRHPQSRRRLSAGEELDNQRGGAYQSQQRSSFLPPLPPEVPAASSAADKQLPVGMKSDYDTVCSAHVSVPS